MKTKVTPKFHVFVVVDGKPIAKVTTNPIDPSAAGLKVRKLLAGGAARAYKIPVGD